MQVEQNKEGYGGVWGVRREKRLIRHSISGNPLLSLSEQKGGRDEQS